MASSSINELVGWSNLDTFFRAFKYGSEVYLTPYLITKGFSNEQINNQIYPVRTYSSLVFTLVFYLIFDEVQPWILLLIGKTINVISYTPLIWGQRLWMMQGLQVIRAMASLFDLHYYKIMEQLFDLEMKGKNLRAFLYIIGIIGCVIGFLAAQGSLYVGWLGYQGLFIGSFIIAVLSLIFVLPLKRLLSTGHVVKKKPSKSSSADGSLEPLSLMGKIRACYGNMEILLLSLMGSINAAFYMIGEYYGTSYWYEVSIANGSGYDMSGIMYAIAKIGSVLGGSVAYRLFDGKSTSDYFIFLLAISIALNSGACFFLIKWMKSIPAACIFWTLYMSTGHFVAVLIFRRLAMLAPGDRLSRFMTKCKGIIPLCLQTLFQLIVSGTGFNLSLSSRYLSLSMISGGSLIILPFLYFYGKQTQPNTL